MKLFSLLLELHGWMWGRGSIKMGSIFVIVLCLFVHIIQNSILLVSLKSIRNQSSS